MQIPGSFLKAVSEQLEYNRSRNLFHEPDVEWPWFNGLSQSRFIEFQSYLQSHPGCEEVLAQHLSYQGLKSMLAAFQFLQPDKRDSEQLVGLYRKLISDIRDSLNAEEVASRHRGRLWGWLSSCDAAFAEACSRCDKTLNPATCAFYSADFILKIFGIDASTIKGKILDIGCGEEGLLVERLRKAGLEAVGFDRMVRNPSDFIMECDWFAFDFQPLTWDLILANQSFSLHFLHFHFRQGDRALHFARLYHRILVSLKPGGRFLYAPSLPFIEGLLPADQFLVHQHHGPKNIGVSTITRKL